MKSIEALKFGCFPANSDGTQFLKLGCAAEGTNVLAEVYTDDKCTKVATGDSKMTVVVTEKDVTETTVSDGKTVTEVRTYESATSTCNGGSSAPVVSKSDTTPVCPKTDGSVMPWAATNTMYAGAPCYCGDNEKLKMCGEGSACNSKADAPCVCTPE